jgi:hypothetical protein
MAFRFQKAACVVQGAFNIYIIQPEWLAKKGIWPQAENLVVETLRKGPGFRYWSEGLPSRWIITPFQAVLETRSAQEDLGPTMQLLLEKLPETPLFSIMNIFRFRGEKADIANVVPSLTSSEGPDTILQKSQTALVEIGGVRYYSELGWDQEQGQADLSVSSFAEAAAACDGFSASQHAKQFLAHRQTGLDFVRRYWKVDIHAGS